MGNILNVCLLEATAGNHTQAESGPLDHQRDLRKHNGAEAVRDHGQLSENIQKGIICMLRMVTPFTNTYMHLSTNICMMKNTKNMF